MTQKDQETLAEIERKESYGTPHKYTIFANGNKSVVSSPLSKRHVRRLIEQDKIDLVNRVESKVGRRNFLTLDIVSRQ